MIALLSSIVLASPLVHCAEEPRWSLSAGADVVAHYDGLVPADPFFGYGVDLAATRSVLPCMHLGVREYVVNNAVSDPPYETGWEWHFLTHAVVGGHVWLGRHVRVAGEALPGVRTTWVGQNVQMPARDLELTYRHVAFTPSLYSRAEVAVYPVDWLGVRIDAVLPVLYPYREKGWFRNRAFGVGVTVRPPARTR